MFSQSIVVSTSSEPARLCRILSLTFRDSSYRRCTFRFTWWNKNRNNNFTKNNFILNMETCLIGCVLYVPFFFENFTLGQGGLDEPPWYSRYISSYILIKSFLQCFRNQIEHDFLSIGIFYHFIFSNIRAVDSENWWFSVFGSYF